jgi:hypothetical protein
MAVPNAAPASPHPPGDHYLCYKAALAPRQAKLTLAQKTLEDQLGTNVFDVKKIARFCTAAQKDTEPPPTHPSVHQVGYQIRLAKTPRQAPFVRSDHVGIDQLGTHALTLLKPTGILVPSASILGSGGAETVDTHAATGRRPSDPHLCQYLRRGCMQPVHRN